MSIRYFEAPDVKKLVDEIAESLDFFHVVPQFVFCFRSKGSTSLRTVARIHGLGKIWQEALNLPPSYVIEVISERYDRLTQAEKEKTIIHELLHIPHTFAGGFRPHKGYIDRETVETFYRKLQMRRAYGKTSI
ncbi:MAG: putative metallopeptidase [Candidatus Bathyarchaeota archaeon]|nr:putative metallopeptidase [Candidatus Bathyarchaeota archaeon]